MAPVLENTYHYNAILHILPVTRGRLQKVGKYTDEKTYHPVRVARNIKVLE